MSDIERARQMGKLEGCVEEIKADTERQEAILSRHTETLEKLVHRFDSFENFIENGLSQKIAQVLAERGKERNRKWRFAALIIGMIVGVGSIVTTVLALINYT